MNITLTDFIPCNGRNKEDGAGEHVALIEKIRSAPKILVGKLERIRPIPRSKRKWEDDIKLI
jgi:hypothetical protein